VLVSAANVGASTGDPVFDELDPTNNASWVRFNLKRPMTGKSKGNASLRLLSDACDDPGQLSAYAAAAARFASPGSSQHDALVDALCGGKAQNR
jgi:hypothetical protein